MCSAGHRRTSGFSSAMPCPPFWRKPSPGVFVERLTGASSVSNHPKHGSIAFQPRARLLKLIGEELISDEVVALAELVKNAHDADASHVTVTFRRVTSPQGSIEIRDDGFGMDVSTLLGRWMEPAA